MRTATTHRDADCTQGGVDNSMMMWRVLRGEWMSPKRAGESPVDGVAATIQGVAADVDEGEAIKEGGVGYYLVDVHVAADAGEGQAGESATRRRCRGHQPGTPGKSHNNKPEFVKRFVMRMCGRTDLQPYESVWKTAVYNTECRRTNLLYGDGHIRTVRGMWRHNPSWQGYNPPTLHAAQDCAVSLQTCTR